MCAAPPLVSCGAIQTPPPLPYRNRLYNVFLLAVKVTVLPFPPLFIPAVKHLTKGLREIIHQPCPASRCLINKANSLSQYLNRSKWAAAAAAAAAVAVGYYSDAFSFSSLRSQSITEPSSTSPTPWSTAPSWRTSSPPPSTRSPRRWWTRWVPFARAALALQCCLIRTRPAEVQLGVFYRRRPHLSIETLRRMFNSWLSLVPPPPPPSPYSCSRSTTGYKGSRR